jgi:hypothetical protein
MDQDHSIWLIFLCKFILSVLLYLFLEAANEYISLRWDYS